MAHPGALRDPAIDELLEAVRQLDGKVERLLATQRPAGPRDAGDRRLVLVLGAAFAGAPFTSSEVLERAHRDGVLHAALARCDTDTPTSLGKVLARLDGHAVEGLAVARLGEDRTGACRWLVRAL